MFGYIQANVRELKVREYETYRSYYCGLCHTLQERYGRQAGLLLNYDMTFLAILLSGLYEPEESAKKGRCVPHPVKRHPYRLSGAVEYAADMTILLSFQKAVDDRKDKKSFRGGVTAGLLKKDYAAMRKRYPRQAGVLERSVHALWEAEEAKSAGIDRVAGLTGAFLGEMFVWKEDEWADTLRDMGFFLGKFIYLMDAVEDLAEDRKKGNYNLLLTMGEVPVREILIDTMANSCRSFEKLPIIESAGILRNILYSGVWMKYNNAVKNKDVEKDEKSI